MDIKEQLITKAYEWIDSKIDAYASAYSKNKFTDMLVGQAKRVAHNVVGKMEHKLDEIMFYITDKDGNINVGKFDDASLKEAFEQMPRRAFQYGEIGQGSIDIRIPDNFITNLVMGDNKLISFKWDDIKELKDMISQIKTQ